MSDWDVQKSSELYGIEYWGADYFRINSQGNVEASPQGLKGPKIDLMNLVEDLIERGIRMPMLLRFPDIVKSRIDLLTGCFARAIKEYNYQGEYRGVYPIKVNQQRHLVEEIIDHGREHKFGLEAGSKPELLISLAMMDTPDALIICNGFKDPEYIEMALISQKLGRKTIIVVDRMAELEMIVTAAKKLGIRPKIGLRAKLYTPGAGRWAETSGARSKFGLTPSEIVHSLDYLRQQEMLDSLELLHFHIGSQIPSIQSIKMAIREAARTLTEIYNLGGHIRYLDVGGGLGVDYDGSGRSDSSTNYSEQEYANDVVSSLLSICDEKKVPHPHIISESGRSLVAHTSVLIFDVLGMNEVAKKDYQLTEVEKESRLVQDLWDIYQNVNKKNINEFYNDWIEKKRDTQNLYNYGVLSLEQRAKADDLSWAIAFKMSKVAQEAEDAEDILKELQRELSDTYFCNFSVFQSIPDSWALDQLFPVIPIHRHQEEPTRRATLADLTCDSDGHISHFIDTTTGEPSESLPVHSLKPQTSYYMGAFLAGAYQEILGDLHNLFGDTDTVHVSVTEGGYHVDHVVEGDSVTEVLNYVEYSRSELLEKVRRTTEASILRGTLSRSEARLLLKHYEQGLAGYTYLFEPK